MSFKREVASIEEMNGRTGNVAFERLGTRRQKERIVLSPCRKEAWLLRPKIILESWVERDIALVVAEQVQLDFVGARTSQIKIVERITVWRNRRHVRHTVCVLPARYFRFEKSAQRVTVGLRRIFPIFLNRVPPIAQSFLISVAVLRNNCSDAIRMPNGKAEAHGCAIIEDVHRESSETDYLGEAIDDVRDILKG